MCRSNKLGLFLATLVVAGMAYAADVRAAPQLPDEGAATTEKFRPYQDRFGRDRPLIAVVGENSGTELTDFVIPYGVLRSTSARDR